MKPFVTGSHAYGTPTESSDVDLVILVAPADLILLAEGADNRGSQQDKEYGGQSRSLCLRYGSLNLIATSDDKIYQTWLTGTKQLKARSPVTREEACALFKQLREEQ